MAVQTYDIGDRVRLKATFTLDETATDPDTITFSLKKPDGSIITYEYITDAELLKLSTGVYAVDYDVEDAGAHYYRFVGDGAAIAAAGEGAFVVRTSLVV